MFLLHLLELHLHRVYLPVHIINIFLLFLWVGCVCGSTLRLNLTWGFKALYFIIDGMIVIIRYMLKVLVESSRYEIVWSLNPTLWFWPRLPWVLIPLVWISGIFPGKLASSAAILLAMKSNQMNADITSRWWRIIDTTQINNRSVAVAIGGS